jgi:hypothetical protein
MPVQNQVDFRGGYSTDVPSEMLAENEILIAQNCKWSNGLTKRNGINYYNDPDFTAYSGLNGGIRAHFDDDSWYTIIALDDGVNVHFMYGTDTEFVEIDTTFTFTTCDTVEFAELNGKVVAVNGVDRPAVIYWDGGLVIQTLESYDIRTRNELNWYAGQWDNDGATSYFVDDTVDAQDAGADDFQLGNTTANDGFYVSSDFTFNKVVFTDAHQAGGAPVAEYMYWNGTTWAAFTLVTTPDWTAATGDKTLEFDIPLDSDGVMLWQSYAVTDTSDGVEYKYIIRVRFTTAASGAFTSGHLALYHTQYLRQILEDARPHMVISHNNQIYLAERYIINFSPPGNVTGWREGQAEYFTDGGNIITGMVSQRDALVVFKENTIYTFSTTDLNDTIRSRPLTSVGCIAPRTPKQIGNFIAFLAADGIYLWDGATTSKVSKHIQSDIDSYALANACSAFYGGHYIVAFPEDEIALLFDPDTFRQDDMGDGRVSFYKWTNYRVNQFVHYSGSEDSKELYGLVDDDTEPYMVLCDYGDVDNLGTEENIEMVFKTKFQGFGNFQTQKMFGLLKVKFKEVSARAGERHHLTYHSDDGRDHVHHQIEVPKGTLTHSEEIRLPYQIDGDNISVEVKHNRATSSTILGLSLYVSERRY